MLSNEVLLDILKCADRRSLDNMYLMRCVEHPLHCDQLRTVQEAYLSYTASTYTYSVGFAIRVKAKTRRDFNWRPPTVTHKTLFADVRVDTKSGRRAVDVFTKALLHSHVTGEVRFENVELSRYFVEQMKTVADGYIIDGNSLVLRGVSLKLNVSPTDFIAAFCSLHKLSRSAGDWYNFVGLDDRTLKHFASNGILELCKNERLRISVDTRLWWNCSHVSEDALIEFIFNDAYGEAGLRCFRGRNCQLSPMFLRKLVKAHRASTTTFKACLQVNGDDKRRVEQNLDDLRQFRIDDDYDDEVTWRFEFPDIPDFELEYDAFRGGWIRCWSNLGDEERV